MVMKAGNDSLTSSRLIFLTESTISTPTITNAPLVAAAGMSRKSGAKKMEHGGHAGCNGCSGEKRGLVHSGRGKDGGIDGQDVAHGQECGQSANHFHPHRHFLLVKSEKFLKCHILMYVIWFQNGLETLEICFGRHVYGVPCFHYLLWFQHSAR